MSNYTVTTSAELMENYQQADYLLPQDKFVALQTNLGASLLFSIGTGGSFYLTVETPGAAYGWSQVNLSSAQVAADFAGKATVTTFAAAQATYPQGGQAQVHLAMVLNDGTNDHLYISLNNSDSNLNWTKAPVWTKAPFNAVDGTGKPITPPSPFQIPNVMISEAADAEYVVIDTIRNPGQSSNLLTRYFLDTTNAAAPNWLLHDLPVDISASNYDSCLGRSAKAYGVDGIYTKGMVGSSAQLIYAPIYNAFDKTMPPLPSTLYLPGGLIADAISAVRNPDNTSDLYVAAGGKLFWFADGNQKPNAVGVQVVSTPLLAAARILYSYAAAGTLTVWGLNSDAQVFYLTCPVGQQATAGAWSTPVPIMTGVDALSPYLDRDYSANTFFAHTGTGLVKAVKSPTTTLWTQRPVVLPPTTFTQPATPIHSYTTHVTVSDSTGQAVPNATVSVTASNVTSVYVNHLYYRVGPNPIELTTDALGSVTIVEATETLAGTRFNVTVADQPAIAVNTLDTAWQRNAKYTSTASLQQAQIVNRDGTSRNFVPAGTSIDDLNAVAYSNQCLAKAYTSLADNPQPGTPGAPAFLTAAKPVKLATGLVADTVSATSTDFGDWILAGLGDLLGWLWSGVEAVVELIEDIANGIWHFVVTIGDAIYHAVLDCVEAIVAAATWVYDKIKVAVEDVIKFLEFLFGWQDILTTHRVLKNVFYRMGESAVAGIEQLKTEVATALEDVQSKVNAWAGVTDFNQSAQATLAGNKPLDGQNGAPANLGVHHFQGGCQNSSGDVNPPDAGSGILAALETLVDAEADALGDAADAIKTQIIEPFATLSVTQVLDTFIGIVADTVLQTAENVIVTILDVFAKLLQGVINVLTMPLEIPVLSWLYSEITDGEELSFLDVTCLIAAIPVTIIYKIASAAANGGEGTAPFTKGDAFTEGLIGAQSFAEIQALFVVAAAKPKPVPHGLLMTAGLGDGPPPLNPGDAVLDQSKLKTFGFVTGVASLFGAAVLVVVVTLQRVADLAHTNLWAKRMATVAAAGNFLYVSPNLATLINARTDNWYATLNNVLTCISLAKSLLAIVAANWNNEVVGKVFAFVETFINVVWNVPVIANIVYNSGTETTTYKSLIPESIGNFCFNFGGILEFPIAMVAPSPAKAVLILVQYGFMASYGVFMIIAGGIYQWAPNQEH